MLSLLFCFLVLGLSLVLILACQCFLTCSPSSSELPSSGGLLPPSYSLSAPLSNSSKPIGESRLDWALEREAEIVRLEEENRVLRELLEIGREGEERPIASVALPTGTKEVGR